MAFATGLLNEVQSVGSGEKYGQANDIITATTFEDGLTSGRFCKLDTGSIDNLDASATPTVAGVVLRNPTTAIEDGSNLTAANNTQIEYLRAGLVTVDVITGITPTAFGDVFVHNVADANIGKATTTDDANTEPTTAEWVEEIATDVWLVRLK